MLEKENWITDLMFSYLLWERGVGKGSFGLQDRSERQVCGKRGPGCTLTPLPRGRQLLCLPRRPALAEALKAGLMPDSLPTFTFSAAMDLSS